MNDDGARIRRIPDKVPSLTIVSFTDTSASLAWTDLTGAQTGNSDLISYQLFYDDATGQIDQLLLESLATEYEVLALSGGEAYQFQVRAVNIYGPGTLSDPVSQTVSNVPGKPAMVSVTLSDTNVLFAWAKPDENFSSITAYNLELRKHDGSWVTDSVNCDAS